MVYRLAGIGICLAGLLVSGPATAAPIASCNSTLTVCGIPENILLQLPFTATAGDVVLTESNGTTVSDVFRISNNILNTGVGTGLGNMVFLYSSDDMVLPAPSTYSANAVFLAEDPSGITSYVSNGKDYLLGVPEPQTVGLLSFAVAAFVLVRRRSRIVQGGL